MSVSPRNGKHGNHDVDAKVPLDDESIISQTSNRNNRANSKRRPPLVVDGEEKIDTRIWIGGLAHSIKDRDLEDVCKKFGKIKAVKIIHATKDNYAFIDFDDPAAACKAVKELHETKLGEK